MGIFHGPRYKLTTSGLIVNLDAGDTSSYSGSGTTWNDLSGNAYNATMSNVTFTTNYMTFNGTSSLVTIPVPKPTMPLTFEFWINPDTSTPVGLYDTAANLQDVLRQYDDVTVNGRAEWWNKDPSISLGLTGSTWQQIVLVYSFTTVRTITYYRNGGLVSTTTGTGNSNFAWNNPIRIGDINNGSSGRYAGKISTIRIYNTDLGATGALNNYNYQRRRFGL